MTRILIFGKNGQIGSALPAALRGLGIVNTLGSAELNLRDTDMIRAAIRAYKPDILVNAAAYTAVDKAESEPALAMQINGTAPGVMAEEALRLGTVLVHYSTDYVFDGLKATPYVEDDDTNPLSVYGKTKLAGELAIRATGAAHYILRTSWVYSSGGANFMNTMLRLGRDRPELRIVDDQTGAPTWATAIADMTGAILTYAASHRDDPCHGTYHLTAAGSVTWFGFAQAIFAEAEKTLGLTSPRLIPVTTTEYHTLAQRPANSQLDLGRLQSAFGIQPEPWLCMLEACMRGKTPAG